MQSDGTYLQHTASEGRSEGSHRLLIARAEKRLKEIMKKKKLKKVRK
jgi:hypothetical protein